MWALVALGIGLRLWQMTGGASLWGDEVALARNIVERSYTDLLRPLDYGQVAPPGFLLLEKLTWSVLGGSDWTLRLVPLLAAIVSVFLFRGLALRVVRPAAALLAVAMFSLGMPFIFYGATVKQYSSDVAVALALTLGTLAIARSSAPRGRLAVLGTAGFLAVWISSPAVLVVTGLGATLFALHLARRDVDARRIVWLVLVPWALGAGGAAVFAVQSLDPGTRLYMHEWWRSGFAPLSSPIMLGLRWLWYDVLSGPYGPLVMDYRLASGFVLLGLVGTGRLWRVDRGTAMILAAPVAVTFLAAIAQQYPFQERLILFLTPGYLLWASAGAETVAAWLRSHARAAGWMFLALVLESPLERIVADHPVYRVTETRQLYSWLRGHWQQGDALWVKNPAMLWYWALLGITARDTLSGITARDTVMSGCWPEEPRKVLREIDRLRGRPRAWLLGARNRDIPLPYADSIGWRRDGLRVAPVSRYGRPVEVWLYDFSDSARLARQTADRFNVSVPRVSPIALLGCRYGTSAPKRIRKVSN
jgi:hypothetical protein